jgi:hypothetical protein
LTTQIVAVLVFLWKCAIQDGKRTPVPARQASEFSKRGVGRFEYDACLKRRLNKADAYQVLLWALKYVD